MTDREKELPPGPLRPGLPPAGKRPPGRTILWIAGLALAAAAGIAVVGRLMLTGPRMIVQPKLATFQAELPRLPAGVVTVEAADTLPAAGQANPLPPEAATLAAGAAYYVYYCQFCHGETGDGNGPVGESYVPRPTDLRTAAVQRMQDGELYRAMLLGTGHEPVLRRTVPERHRWPLVHYLRQLPRKRGVR